jgi:hypothetical protein
MSKQHLTAADQTYVGAGVVPPMYSANERKGAPVTWQHQADLGSPIALDVNALVAAATSTEMPNAATKTYTTATAGASPLDDAGKRTPATVTMADGAAYSVWPLDVPRNITMAVTAAALLALSVKITGFDKWGYKLVETLSTTATGTSKTAVGKKAFKWVSSIAIIAAGDTTDHTLNVGFGDALGLPYALQRVADHVRAFFNDAVDTPTLVKADATTATATTGDTRGTLTPGSSCNGSAIVVWYHIDGSTDVGLNGVAQYAG